MVAGRTHNAKCVPRAPCGHAIHRVQNAAHGLSATSSEAALSGVSPVEQHFVTARDIVLHDLDIFARVAGRQFVFAGGARRDAQHSGGQARGIQRGKHGVEPCGPLRVARAWKVALV